MSVRFSIKEYVRGLITKIKDKKEISLKDTKERLFKKGLKNILHELDILTLVETI